MGQVDRSSNLASPAGTLAAQQLQLFLHADRATCRRCLTDEAATDIRTALQVQLRMHGSNILAILKSSRSCATWHPSLSAKMCFLRLHRWFETLRNCSTHLVLLGWRLTQSNLGIGRLGSTMSPNHLCAAGKLVCGWVGGFQTCRGWWWCLSINIWTHPSTLAMLTSCYDHNKWFTRTIVPNLTRLPPSHDVFPNWSQVIWHTRNCSTLFSNVGTVLRAWEEKIHPYMVFHCTGATDKSTTDLCLTLDSVLSTDQTSNAFPLSSLGVVLRLTLYFWQLMF